MKVENKQVKGLLECIGGIQNCLAEIDRFQTKKLSRLLPMCAWCRKIRDDQGCWKKIETSEHSDMKFTHGICPDCAGKLIEEIG